MFVEFDRMKKLASQTQAELAKSDYVSTARNDYFRDIIAKSADKLGMDMKQIESETKRLTAEEAEQIRKARKESIDKYLKQLAGISQSSRQAWQQFMAETDSVWRASSGNPHIWITSDTATVRQLEPEIDHTPPPGINDRRIVSADARFVPYSRNNEFNLRLHVDNADKYFRNSCTYATVRMIIEFSLDAPEGNWFLVRSIWSPLTGNGTFSWLSGVHPWWSRSLIESHGLRGYGNPYSPLALRGGFSQEGWSQRFEWGTSFGTGDPAPHPGFEPFYVMEFDGGPYDMPDFLSQVYDAFFLIRGRASGGGRITFRMAITCSAAASHAHEFDYVSFWDPGFLMFPGLLLTGERIDL